MRLRTAGKAVQKSGLREEGYTQEGTPFLYRDDLLYPETSPYPVQARWYDPSSSSLSPDPEMGEARDSERRFPYVRYGGDPVYHSDPPGSTLTGTMDG